MSDMGRHTTLVNGHRGEDGAIVAAPVIAPLDLSGFLSRPRGPVSALPQPPRPDIAPPAETPRRVRLDGDKLRRGSMWLLASGVAAIAAIVSYSHIYDLGRAHGGSGVAARLLPLSVDMLILVGELMLLHEADAKGRRFMLGWVLVWSGILATLAANVAYGAQYGAVGALIWGWPAYSFILAAGGMVAVVKRGANRDEGEQETDAMPDMTLDTDTGSTADTGTDMQQDSQPDTLTARDTDKPQVTPETGKRPAKRPVTGQDKAAAILRRNPNLTNAEVAKRASVSEKTVQRARGVVAPKGQE